MTGTAVNPLLRAAYLAKAGKQRVTLLVPWLSAKDQALVYPNSLTFQSPAEQEVYVRDWLEQRVGFRSNFDISFYPGRFSTEKRSILAVGDIMDFVPETEADVAVLEEPEHLTWYHHGQRWTKRFQHVVGVVHTNYLEYVRREKNGAAQAFVLEHVNNWLARSYCHKVLRLSAATQELPRSMVCNVHGVCPKFLDIGERVASAKLEGRPVFNRGAYYLGKMVWSKGYRELVDLLAENKATLGSLKVDVFGTGEDSGEVQATAQARKLRMRFHKGRDHADAMLQQYKVFINPSLSDVVCTTTAEALAMGKLVVCADHPSNEFFRSFPNCLIYKTGQEFVEKVQEAVARDPVPLTAEQRHLLSWEAATDRFIESADLDKPLQKEMPRSKSIANLASAGGNMAAAAAANAEAAESELAEKKLGTLSLSMSAPDLTALVDSSLQLGHFMLSGIEMARIAGGALPNTMLCRPEHAKDMGLPPSAFQQPVYGL
eukprot:SM000286S10648  [mRNA]  locus=s286:82703:85018:+ [translate_table: standard]